MNYLCFILIDIGRALEHQDRRVQCEIAVRDARCQNRHDATFTAHPSSRSTDDIEVAAANADSAASSSSPSRSRRDLPTRNRLPPNRRAPQAKVDAFAQALGKNPKFKKLSPKYLQAVTEFVIGNTLFVMLHELGHATTNQLKIPVLGRKEDAADMFAATRLIKLNNDFTDGVLDAAAKGWFMTDRRDTKSGDTVPYYDEHGLDQQRAYQIVCLMIGTGDPKYQRSPTRRSSPRTARKPARTITPTRRGAGMRR